MSVFAALSIRLRLMLMVGVGAGFGLLLLLTALFSFSAFRGDIRQVSGYARLHKVRKALKLDLEDDRNINCLIIYPDIHADQNMDFTIRSINQSMVNSPVKVYHKIYKLGITLPVII